MISNRIFQVPLFVGIVFVCAFAGFFPLNASAKEIPDDRTLGEFYQSLLRGDTSTAMELLLANTNIAQVAPTESNRHSPLLVAVSKGHLGIVEQLLKLGADVNADGDTWDTWNHRFSPLEISAKNNYQAVFDLLILAGADVNHLSKFEGGALHIALHYNRPKMAEILLEHGAKPLVTAGYPVELRTPLAINITHGNGNLVPRMLKIAGDSSNDLLRTNGLNLLRISGTRGQLAAVESLLGAGVSPNSVESGMRPILHDLASMSIALSETNLIIRDRIIAAGAKYDVFAASGFGDLEVVKTLLGSDANLIASRDQAGDSPLHWSVRMNRENVTSFLLGFQELHRATNVAGQTPLHIAASLGLTNQIRLLISDRTSHGTRDTNGWTPLDAAMKAGRAESIRMLASVPGVSLPVGRGIRLKIHEAAANGDMAMLGNLAVLTNIDSRDELGFTPFQLAVKAKQLEAAALLIDRGADVNARDGSGNTALHLIVNNQSFNFSHNLKPPKRWIEQRMQNPKQAQFLIKLAEDCGVGADEQPFKAGDEEATRQNLLSRRSWGWQPRLSQVVGFLLACGSDASATNVNGETPMQLLLKSDIMAREDERISILKLLCLSGENIDARDNDGNTALHRAVIAVGKYDFEALDTMESLIKAGADINATNAAGQTPLHLAVATAIMWSQNEGGGSPVQILVNAKANLNARDINGQTPLQVAAGSFRDESVGLLISSGAILEITNHPPKKLIVPRYLQRQETTKDFSN